MKIIVMEPPSCDNCSKKKYWGCSDPEECPFIGDVDVTALGDKDKTIIRYKRKEEVEQ